MTTFFPLDGRNDQARPNTVPCNVSTVTPQAQRETNLLQRCKRDNMVFTIQHYSLWPLKNNRALKKCYLVEMMILTFSIGQKIIII